MQPERDERHVMIGVQPAIKRIGAEIGRVLRHQRGVVVVRVAEEDPAHVRPEAAVARRVRIAVVIRMLMVNAVGRHPEDRAAFERQRSADRQEVLERFRRLVAAMGVQPVIAEADAEADRHPMQHDGHQQIGPAEIEKRRDRQNMKDHHHAAVIQFKVECEYSGRTETVSVLTLTPRSA